MSVKETMTALADKIRSYTGKTDLLGIDDMVAEMGAVANVIPIQLIADTAASVVVPKGCPKVRAYAFYYRKSLKSVVVESTQLNGVYASAFNGCSYLEEFRIADKCNIKRFGSKAFYNCPALKVVDLSNYSGTSVPVLDEANAFYRVHEDCVIIVPAKLYKQWISATNWSAVGDMIVSA